MVSERSASPGRRRLILAGLALWSVAALLTSRHFSLTEIVWPDECIYVVGTRNVLERHTLNTNYYLAYSLARLGYPHRDVHMPGYILSLAPFVALLGPRLEAGVALNALALVGSVLLVHRIGLRLLGSELQATVAAALLPILPPFPGYYWVAFPELLIAFAQLAGIAWLLRGRGAPHAAVAGVIVGLGALLRESLLTVVPLYLLTLRPRDLLRGFLPGLGLTLAVVVAPLSQNRAVHPNGLYPSVFEEAAQTGAPVRALAGALWKNVEENVGLTLEADPRANAEDLILVFLGLLTLAALAAVPLHREEGSRRFALATLAALLATLAAMLALYVIRVRGGVWGGVRALMPWAPLLLIVAIPILTRWRAALSAGLVGLAAVSLLAVDRAQLATFRHWKAAELEDQERLDAYLEEYVAPQYPHRVLGASFRYGLTHYPVEVVWKVPRSPEDVEAFSERFPFEFFVVHGRSRARDVLRLNPRFARVNQERHPEWVVWRRLY